MKTILTNKWTLIGLVVAILLLAWYFYSKRWKKFSDNGQGGALYWSETRIENAPASVTGGGLLGFRSNGPHGLKVGDRVEIKQDPGAKYPQYDGESVVTHVPTQTIFVIDKGFAGNSPVNPGSFRKIG